MAATEAAPTEAVFTMEYRVVAMELAAMAPEVPASMWPKITV